MPTAEEYLIRIQLQIQNDRALKALTTQLDQAARQVPKTERAMKTAATGTRNFGFAAQNAGYQVQDFIVQVQGGTDPMRALSQQLPQLTVGMGAMGAGIGVAAAAIPALIALMSDAESAGMTWEQSLSALDASVSDLANTTQAVDFSNWIDQFNQVEQAARSTQVAVLEAQVTASESAFQRAVTSMTDQVAREAGASWWDNFIEGAFQGSQMMSPTGGSPAQNQIADALGLADFAERYQIPSDVARQTRDLFAAFDEGEVTLEGLNNQFAELVADTKGATDEFYALREAVTRQTEAEQKLAEARKLANQAASAAPGSILPGGSDKGGRGGSGGGGGGGGSSPRDRSDEINAQRLKAVNASLQASARYLAEQEAAARTAREEQEKLVALWAKANPELAAYHQQVTFLKEAYDAGFMSQERFTEGMTTARARLDDSLQGWSLGEEAIKLFESSFDTMLDGVLMGTRDMAGAFEDMAKVIIAQLLKLAAYEGISRLFAGTAVGNAFANGGAGLTASGKGNVFQGGNLIPFARGGIVSGPTVFPMARGMGLMGEAGPEAVMPLRRGADGRLGVSGGGMNVTINNLAPGVAINQRQTSQGLTLDVVMRSVSTAIQQGGNEVADSLERTYGVGRGRSVY